MASRNAYFAADLSNLMAIGALDLPGIADTYGNLIGKIDGTTDSDTKAFAAYPADAGDTGAATNQVYSAWTELRGLALQALRDSKENCMHAADAVIQIVHIYAENDTESGRILNQVWAHGLPDQFRNARTRDGEPDRLPSSSPLNGESRLGGSS